MVSALANYKIALCLMSVTTYKLTSQFRLDHAFNDSPSVRATFAFNESLRAGSVLTCSHHESNASEIWFD